MANTAAYVLGEDMRPVEAGEAGELYIASHNLALGYAGDQGSHQSTESLNPSRMRLRIRRDVQ